MDSQAHHSTINSRSPAAAEQQQAQAVLSLNASDVILLALLLAVVLFVLPKHIAKLLACRSAPNKTHTS